MAESDGWIKKGIQLMKLFTNCLTLPDVYLKQLRVKCCEDGSVGKLNQN